MWIHTGRVLMVCPTCKFMLHLSSFNVEVMTSLNHRLIIKNDMSRQPSQLKPVETLPEMIKAGTFVEDLQPSSAWAAVQ